MVLEEEGLPYTISDIGVLQKGRNTVWDYWERSSF